MTPLRLVVLVVLAALVAACPPSDKRDPGKDDRSAPCTKFGQTCEVSPGKLGTCVQKDGCTDATPECFVCQSQH